MLDHGLIIVVSDTLNVSSCSVLVYHVLFCKYKDIEGKKIIETHQLILSFILFYISGGKLSFADFLDVMHTHSKKERIPNEIEEAFLAWDTRKTGQITTSDLKHILCQWGEKLDPKVVDNLLREANAAFKSTVNYNDLLEVISAPVPDY